MQIPSHRLTQLRPELDYYIHRQSDTTGQGPAAGVQREARRPTKSLENTTYDIKLKETMFCLSEGEREGKMP